MEVPEMSGFELIAVVVGLVQFLKGKFHLEGNGAEWLTFGLGFVLFGYWSANQAGVIPEAVNLYAGIVVRTLGYALAIPGLFKVVKHELLPAVAARRE